MSLHDVRSSSPEPRPVDPTLTPDLPGDLAEPDGTMAIDETDRLIASDKVAGTAVYGRDGERLGSVYNFMVDKVSGQVAYAVMSFGGFLGLGERFHPLPWKALTYRAERGGYEVDLDRDRLEKAPSYRAGEEPWTDPAYGQNVYGFYGFNYGL